MLGLSDPGTMVNLGSNQSGGLDERQCSSILPEHTEVCAKDRLDEGLACPPVDLRRDYQSSLSLSHCLT